MLFPWRHGCSIYLEFISPRGYDCKIFERGLEERQAVCKASAPPSRFISFPFCSLFLTCPCSLGNDKMDLVMRYRLSRMLLHLQTFSGRKRNSRGDRPLVGKWQPPLESEKLFSQGKKPSLGQVDITHSQASNQTFLTHSEHSLIRTLTLPFQIET